MQHIWQFLVDHFPDGRVLAWAGPIGLLWSCTCLSLAGWFKRRFNWPTGYTRKMFHFLTFGTVAFVYALVPIFLPDLTVKQAGSFGTTLVCVFGGMTSLVVCYAIVRGPGNVLYEAIARESDAPLRTRYIVWPYVATLVGGVLAFAWFGKYALAGVLVAGVADAIAEPIGVRFGRHRYPVAGDYCLLKTRMLVRKFMTAVGLVGAANEARWAMEKDTSTSYRSIEGSLAVFVAALVCVIVVSQLINAGARDAHAWSGLIVALAIASTCTLVEALSPHGWDNLTIQLVPSWMLWAMA